MNDFIKNFADIFDETEMENFSPSTRFRDLDEWSSLHALAAINMIDIKYSVQLKGEEMKKTNTVQELFDLVISKK